MINKKKLFIGMTMILVLIFFVTYYLSDKYIANKNVKNNAVEASETNKNNQLSDNTKIYLFSGEKKEKELTISELKKELNIDGSLTKEELSKALSDKGYVLELNVDGKMTYKKDMSKAVKPNKYYIGEKDGFLAIYKSDKNGILLIESNKDIYSDNKKVDNLREIDRTKIRNFEFEYESKEEAEENLSEFIS